MIVFSVAFLLRIIYNIVFMLYDKVNMAYTISSFFVYLLCVAAPLLLVFFQHLKEVSLV
jgi:hypothetical protein